MEPRVQERVEMTGKTNELIELKGTKKEVDTKEQREK